MKIHASVKKIVLTLMCSFFLMGLWGGFLFPGYSYASPGDESDIGPGTGLATGYGAYGTYRDTSDGDELKGVWISYLEWERLPKERKSFEKAK